MIFGIGALVIRVRDKILKQSMMCWGEGDVQSDLLDHTHSRTMK